MEPRHEIVGARSTFWRETHFLRQLFSAVRNIHKTKSATCFHCCRAHQRYSQTIAIPLSLLGSYLQVQFAIWLCHYGRRCHYLFSSFAIFGCSGNTTNKTMHCTKCSQNPIRVRKVQSSKVEAKKLLLSFHFESIQI